MADKFDPTTIPEPGQMSSDRARRINSLHRSVEDLVQEQNQKRLQVSTEISALTKEQQNMMKQLNEERGQFTQQTASAYDGVVRNLGKTIQNLSIGVKNITTETASATAGAIGQYGRAVGEDININKQNTMAMALSRATPLFGYFAAKFMETDVFKGAAEKMRDKAKSALSSVGESIGNIIRRRKAGKTGIEEGDIPKMQTGGFVKKGGIVEVHAAEVVTPIDKILKQIDEAKTEEISNKLYGVLSNLSRSMIRMETVVEKYEDNKKDVVGTFISEFKKAQNVQQKSWQDRMLKAITELKVAMVGTASRLRIAWQRTILQHPVFRSLLMFGQTMDSVVKAPFSFFFGLRGGFGGEARRATRTSNIYQQQVNMLVLIYTKGMTFLRNIQKYTQVAAEALVGEKVSPVTSKTYTLFGKVKEMMTSRSITTFKQDAWDMFVNRLNLDKSALKEAGINSFTDLLTPSVILKNMGITKENIRGKMSEGPDNFGEYADKARKKYDEMAENISKLTKMKKDQEEREGPHSPSMAENIASTSAFTEQKYKEDKKTDTEKIRIWDKIKGYGKTQAEKMSGLSSRFKKMGKGIKSWFPIIFGFLSRIGNALFTLVKPILTLASTVGMFFASQAGKLLTGGARAVGGLFGGASTAAASGGAAGVAGWAAKGAATAAGTVAAAGTGALIGGWMTLKDIYLAITNPDEFAGNVLVRAFSAAFGGAGEAGKGGLAGTKRGALKGGALGAAIGIVGGPMGVAIGGAIGALAGGVLGFIGGENISKYMSKSLEEMRGLISGIWKVVTFPFRLLKEGIKSFWVLTKFVGKKLFGYIDDWLSGPGFIGTMWDKFKGFVGGIIDKVGGFFGAIGTAFSEFFAKIDFQTIKEFAQKALLNLMFPLVGFMKAFRSVRDWADKKIEAIPIIGPMYKKAKGVISDVNEGTLASKLESALESTQQQDEPKVVTHFNNRSTRQQLTRLRDKNIRLSKQRIMDSLGATAIRMQYGRLSEVMENGRWRRATPEEIQMAQGHINAATIATNKAIQRSQLASSYAEQETSKSQLVTNKLDETTAKLSKKMDDTSKNQAQATISSANIISTSNQNNINNNNNGGGGFHGGGAWFSGNDGAAQQVAAANIN
jgi:uncharacterized protein with PIN domain